MRSEVRVDTAGAASEKVEGELTVDVAVS